MRNGRDLFTPKGGGGGKGGSDEDDPTIPPAPKTPPNVMRTRALGMLVGALVLFGCTKQDAKTATDAVLDTAPILCAGLVALTDDATLDNICHITNVVDPKVKDIAHQLMAARRKSDAAAREGACKPLQPMPHPPL
jgi:hypothetical protein